MIEQLMSLDLVTPLTLKLDLWLRTLEAYLSGANNLKVISLILMVLAVVLFLFLIIIIYIRSIVYFVKGNNPSKNINSTESDENLSAEEDDEEQQLELERELQRELDLALAKQAAEQQLELENKIQQENVEKNLKAEQKKQKKAAKEAADKKEQDEREEKAALRERGKGIEVDFDWQKGKIPPAELAASANDAVSLSYKQSQQELSQLIGLVIDMFGRGVDDLKIAQTLNFKNQGLADENEILKTIDALKSFIDLCLSGKFVKLPQYAELPKEDQALYHLANGDPSLALALLENLMDTNIDKANAGSSEERRQKIYGEVSGYACCFGALAEMNDIMLATSAYELAIELQSTNVTAWSRLGDVYKKASSMPKAVWAYQNVLNFADGEIEISQIANANRHLSEHLYAEGNSLQAAKLYNSAKQYYDSLGINRRLDKQEIEIIEIIENNQQASLPETIRKLLFNGNENA